MIKKLPSIIAIAFVSVTLSRIANLSDEVFNSNPFWGWVFAICIGATVFVSSYFNKITAEAKKRNSEDQTKFETDKSKRLRISARNTMITFGMVDGLLNLTEVVRNLENIDFKTDIPNSILILISAIVYGVIPTIAVSMLGNLQSHIDKLPKGSKSVNWAEQIEKKILNVLNIDVKTVKTKRSKRSNNVNTNTEQKLNSLTKDEKTLYTILQNNGHHTKEDIAKQMNVSRTTVYTLVGNLRSKNLVEGWKAK